MDYPCKRHLHCLSYSGLGANTRLHSLIRGKDHLDIYIKRYAELATFSRLWWKACHKMMIFIIIEY